MEADLCTRNTHDRLPQARRSLIKALVRRADALLNGSESQEMASGAKPVSASPAPTPGPWTIEDDELVYRHWRYASYPLLGRISVARLDRTWPQGEERQANLELIATAVNACFAIAPQAPIAAARAFPVLVNAVEDFLAHGEDPNMPLDELKARLRTALSAARGGAA